MVDAVGPVGCEIHAGEVIGFVGLRGAGQESIGRALFGVIPTSGGRVLLDGETIAAASPAGGDALRRQSGLRRSGRRIRSCRTSPFARTCSSIRSPRASACFSVLAPGRESRAAFDLGQQSGLEAKRSDAADRTLVRRQSAEGRGRALAASRREGLRVRGSDGRRRCRRQGGDLPAIRRRSAGRRRYRDRLDRFRGGRQGAATARWCSIAAASSLNSPPPTCRSRICSPRPPPASGTPAKAAAAAFIDQRPGRSCSQLNPTRSSLHGRNLPCCRAGERSDVWLPVYGLPILTDPADRLLLVASAGHASRPRSTRARSSATRRSSRCCRCAATLPMMAGRIDLTIGFGIVMWHILAISLQVKFGVPWPVAILIVRRLRSAGRPRSTASSSKSRKSIRSSPRSAPARSCTRSRSGCTEGRQIIGSLPPRLHRDQHNARSLGIPIPAIYVLVVAVVFGSSASGCPLVVMSTRSAPTRRPPRSTASRSGPTSSACLSPPG
mgnify:CR=1 FL=1